MEKQSGFAGLPDFGHVPRYAVPVAAGLAALGFAYANKEKIEPHVEYGKYLIPHKWYVGKAMREADLGWGQTLKHDLSKFGPSEWPQYVAYFNGPTGITGTNDKETYMEWRKAVQHHYKNNEHHWRALHKEPKDVPMKYRLEAIADWYGVNRAKGKTEASFKNWYRDKETFLPIDNATKEEMRKRLGMGPMQKTSSVFDFGPIMHSVRKSMNDFTHLTKNKTIEEFSALKAKVEPLVHESIRRLPVEDRKQLLKEWQTTVNIAAPRPVMKTEQVTNNVKVVTDPPLTTAKHFTARRYERTGDVMADMVGGKIEAHMPSKYAAAKKPTKPPVPSVNAPHVPMSQVVASLDPMIQAMAKNMDPAKQKTMWKRYAEIVLEKRNYGRRGRVADEYIKTKIHKD